MDWQIDRKWSWAGAVRGRARIAGTCVWLSKTYYFGTWTRQKSDRTRIWPDPVRFKPVWSTLGWFLVRFGSVFCKKVFAALGGKHISEKQLQALSIRFCTFLLPKRPQKEQFLSLYWPFSLLLAVPIAIFPFFDPFGILMFAHDLCIFSVRSPVSKNDRMPHTYIFVNFVAIDATLHQTCKLQAIFFIFLMLQLTFRLAFFKSILPAKCTCNDFSFVFYRLGSATLIRATDGMSIGR